MADKDGFKVAKDYHVGVPFANQEGFYVKGANSLDWGMKKHLSNSLLYSCFPIQIPSIYV